MGAYNPSVTDRRGEIWGNAYANIGNTFAGLISAGFQGQANKQKEVDYLGTSWEMMKKQDPTLTEWDDKFAAGSLSTKRALVTQGQATWDSALKQKEMDLQHQNRLAEIAAQHPSPTLTPYQTEDGKTLYLTPSGQPVDLPQEGDGTPNVWEKTTPGGTTIYGAGRNPMGSIRAPKDGPTAGFIDHGDGTGHWETGNGTVVHPEDMVTLEPDPSDPKKVKMKPLVPKSPQRLPVQGSKSTDAEGNPILVNPYTGLPMRPGVVEYRPSYSDAVDNLPYGPSGGASAELLPPLEKYFPKR